MPSPFPGMNPYLEQVAVWQDFHQSFLPLIREALAAQVRPAYVVKVEEHLFLHDTPIEARRVVGRSDVSIAQGSVPARPPIRHRDPGGPCHRPHHRDRRGAHAFLENPRPIQSGISYGDRIAKPFQQRAGAGRDLYLAMRRPLLCSNTHVVEFDLLRGAGHLPPRRDPGPNTARSLAVRKTAPAAPRYGRCPFALLCRKSRSPYALYTRMPASICNRCCTASTTAGYEDYTYNRAPEPPLSVCLISPPSPLYSGERGRG